MASAVSASGFGLPDDGEEQLVVEDGDDLGRVAAGMSQQASQLIPSITMQ